MKRYYVIRTHGQYVHSIRPDASFSFGYELQAAMRFQSFSSALFAIHRSGKNCAVCMILSTLESFDTDIIRVEEVTTAPVVTETVVE